MRYSAGCPKCNYNGDKEGGYVEEDIQGIKIKVPCNRCGGRGFVTIDTAMLFNKGVDPL